MSEPHTTQIRGPWLGYACLALSMALVGNYVALSKPLLAAFPVFVLTTLRFLIGAVAMVPWLKRPASEPPMTRNVKWLLFLESFLGNFLFSVCMLFGMMHTSAVAAGIVLSAIPAAVAILSWVFLKERVSWRSWTGISCAAIGIALYSLTKNEQIIDAEQAKDAIFVDKKIWLGIVLLVGAVLCEASYAVIGKRLTAALSPKRISAMINLWGLALVAPAGIWAMQDFALSSVSGSVWWLLIYYGLAASVLTVWLWMTGLKTVPASRAGVFTVMLPISAAMSGVVWLDEVMTWGQVGAFALALIGIVIATSERPGAKPLSGSTQTWQDTTTNH